MREIARRVSLGAPSPFSSMTAAKKQLLRLPSAQARS